MIVGRFVKCEELCGGTEGRKRRWITLIYEFFALLRHENTTPNAETLKTVDFLVRLPHSIRGL